jgi:hypothetical protein
MLERPVLVTFVDSDVFAAKHSDLSYGSGKVLAADWSRSQQLPSGLLVLQQLK